MRDISPSPFLLFFPFLHCFLVLTFGRFRFGSVSIVRYHFRPYSYYPHSTLIMFDIEASVPINSDDVMNSCAMPINFYCTIHLQPTYLEQKQFFCNGNKQKKNTSYFQ